jgi:signal transduction histidine kinase
VIQNLAAAAYALPAVVEKLPPDPCADEARRIGDRIARMLERDIDALRTLTLDQVPELTGDGLRAALEGLTARTTDGGVTGRLAMPPSLDLDPAVAGVVYRVVREGLRNVEQHAEASNAEVALVRDGEDLVVRVSDDGRGPGTVQPPEGHLGLRLLAGLMLDIGGTMRLRESAAGGSVLEARFPAALG